MSLRVFSFVVLSTLTLCCLVPLFSADVLSTCPERYSPLTQTQTQRWKTCWEVRHLVMNTKIFSFDFIFPSNLPGTFFTHRTWISCLMTYTYGSWETLVFLFPLLVFTSYFSSLWIRGTVTRQINFCPGTICFLVCGVVLLVVRFLFFVWRQ
jgi:hypothetical protein